MGKMCTPLTPSFFNSLSKSQGFSFQLNLRFRQVDILDTKKTMWSNGGVVCVCVNRLITLSKVQNKYKIKTSYGMKTDSCV